MFILCHLNPDGILHLTIEKVIIFQLPMGKTAWNNYVLLSSNSITFQPNIQWNLDLTKWQRSGQLVSL